MNMKVMVCGIDCHKGDENCNGYCTGKAPRPNDATPEQKLRYAKKQAHEKLAETIEAWETYSGVCVNEYDLSFARYMLGTLRTASTGGAA